MRLQSTTNHDTFNLEHPDKKLCMILVQKMYSVLQHHAWYKFWLTLALLKTTGCTVDLTAENQLLWQA